MPTRKEAAWEKFEKSLTPKQQELVKEHILSEAIREAEANTEERGYRIKPHYSLYLNPLHRGDPQGDLNAAVYWFHRKHNHLWKMVDGEAHMMSSSEC